MKKICKTELENMSVVGKGACATIYKYQHDKILKLYDRGNRNTAEFVKKEFDISTEIYSMGIATAQPFELCECDGVYGAIYEFVSGDTMLNVIEKEGNIGNYIVELANIGKQIHSNSVDEDIFPKAVELIKSLIVHIKPWVNEIQYKHIEEIVDAIPDSSTLIHGDFHPGNIILKQNKVVLIDVGGASCGHPVFDLISMHRMMMKEAQSKVNDGIYRQIYENYISNYFDAKKFEECKDSFYEIMEIMYYLTAIPSVCVSYNSRENCDPVVIQYIDHMIGRLLNVDIKRFEQFFSETNDLFMISNHLFD